MGFVFIMKLWRVLNEMEKNLKYDQQIIEKLMDAALQILIGDKPITDEYRREVKMSIGYILLTEEETIEALFEIGFTGKRYYFVAQNGNVMAANMNAEMYQQIVYYMMDNHPCLSPESENQRNRRKKNNTIIESMNIVTNKGLMTSWDDEEVVLRDKEDICKRAMCCILIFQIAYDYLVADDGYEEKIENHKTMIEKYGLMDLLNSKEKRIVECIDFKEAGNMTWASEAYWALCWSLGLVDDISDATTACDDELAMGLIKGTNSVEEFISKCNLRSKEEILDMLDLYCRLNWTIHESKTNPDVTIGDLDESVVAERRRGLEWIVSDVDDWYDIQIME